MGDKIAVPLILVVGVGLIDLKLTQAFFCILNSAIKGEHLPLDKICLPRRKGKILGKEIIVQLHN